MSSCITCLDPRLSVTRRLCLVLPWHTENSYMSTQEVRSVFLWYYCLTWLALHEREANNSIHMQPEWDNLAPCLFYLLPFLIPHHCHLHGQLQPLFIPSSLPSLPLITVLCMIRSSAMRRASPRARRGSRGMVSLRERKPLQHLELRKLRKLKKVVPGCRSVGLQALLQRTADYISFLKLKATVLKKILSHHGVWQCVLFHLQNNHPHVSWKVSFCTLLYVLPIMLCFFLWVSANPSCPLGLSLWNDSTCYCRKMIIESFASVAMFLFICHLLEGFKMKLSYMVFHHKSLKWWYASILTINK